MSIKDFAEKYGKAWQDALINGDISTFKALFDNNFVYHAQGPDINLETYMQHDIDLRKYSQIIQVDVKYLTGESNLFAVDFVGRFKFTGNMPGFPPAIGKEITSHYLCLLKVKNGKVTEGWANGSITGLT
jgi:ketosteroid isomerase-like protein